MGRRFQAERRRDPYYRRAQSEGLRSRAAFKLGQLAERFPIFRRGDRVLDLGAAPGGWTLVAREWVGPEGALTAVDPRRIEPVPDVEVLHARVGETGLTRLLAGREYDVILSDMSPRISGAYATDHARSVELVGRALDVAREVLAEGGVFVAKVFEGDLLPEIESRLRRDFGEVHRSKPRASREGSSELYLVALDFARGPGTARADRRRPRAGTGAGDAGASSPHI